MTLSNRLMYALLAIVIVVTIGMATTSWRMVLYPHLLLVGICIFYGLTRAIHTRRVMILIPVGVTLLFTTLFVVLDLLTIRSPTGGEGYVFGLTPSIAFYFLGIAPVALLVSLIYAWTFEAAPLDDLRTEPQSNDRKSDSRIEVEE